jgi:hypothetical protein
LNDALRLLDDMLESHRQAALTNPPEHPSTS